MRARPALALLLFVLVVGVAGVMVAGGRGQAPVALTGAATREDAAAYGAALFRAKGCVTCHSHDAVGAAGYVQVNIGPNLTHYAAEPDFLREWLQDPPALRPGTQMPNLELGEEEIEALIAFLQHDG
jgi:cytochrome c oxidase subunit 2